MASQGLFSIGGIASGLDTAGIVTQLMQLERQPVVKLQDTQAALRRTGDAWTQVTTRLTALRTATDALARPDRFDGMVAVTSSDSAAVTASGTGGSATGSLRFRVTALATAHQVGLRYGAADAPLPAGDVRVQVGGRDVAVATEGKTLDQVARELNAAGGGFTASVLKVGEGDHRLVLTASETGAANRLAVTAAAPQTELQQGADAELVVGTGTGAIPITRPGNTITDLVPGASITLHKTTGDQPVTVSAARDLDAGVKAVKGYVDALNSAMATLKDLSAYNSESKAAGPLQGSPAARQLLMSLREAATAVSGATSLPGAFAVGLEVDRTGKVTLDEKKLRAALEGDFDAVARLFSRAGSATSDAVTSVVGTATTAPGTYEVEVTEAATTAAAAGTAYGAPGGDQTLQISSGGRTATVVLGAEHQTAEAAATAIQRALTEAGITGLSAAARDGRLAIEAVRPGAAGTFTVVAGTAEQPEAHDAFGLAGTHAGADLAGRIRHQGEQGWTPLSGSGTTLSASTGPATGMSLTYGGGLGTFAVTYAQGLAGGMGRALAAAEGVGGLVARARDGISSQIRVYQTRIDAFDQRLATRESTLRRQFTAMETALSSLNAQGSWLASQLAGLSNPNAQG